MSDELIARLEAATGPYRAVDGDIAEQLELVPPFVYRRESPKWATWHGGRDY